MGKNDYKLLDCTLRDGGYVNNWNWGEKTAKGIVNALVKSNVDFVEVGFLRNIDAFNKNVTIGNTIEELNSFLPSDSGNTIFSAMAMCSNYDISKLSPYKNHGIELIRITSHDYDIEEGLQYANMVKEKGYKVSINPINIMGYSDERILWIVQHVNKIQPYQFSIVDTFGSMKWRDLDRIVSLIDHNLNSSIRLALHLHENMSLSCCLAQRFIDCHLNRSIAIDGSLMGIGRIPGNLPIELIADYLNDYNDDLYDIDYMMDAIQDYIASIKGLTKWGYTPAFFLSAKFNLHRNYAEHYLKKGDLTNRDINHLLSKFDDTMKSHFDAEYADNLYEAYNNYKIDDATDKNALLNVMTNKEILVVAPGTSIVCYEELILQHIHKQCPIIISVNFVPEFCDINYLFVSNSKRYSKLIEAKCHVYQIIATSNLIKEKSNEVDHWINYDSLAGTLEQKCNSLIMILRLLRDLGVTKVTVAGADGYTLDGENYYSNSMRTYTDHDNNFNVAVAKEIHGLNIEVEFLTPSRYDIYSKNNTCP
jgi:4-hydroxy 2-oxovalerate aldolase